MVEMLPMAVFVLWVVWRIVRGADKQLQTKWWEFLIAVVILDILIFVANIFIFFTLKAFPNPSLNTGHTGAMTLLTTALISIPFAHILKKRALGRRALQQNNLS